MNLHPIGTKVIIEAEIVKVDLEDRAAPYRVRTLDREMWIAAESTKLAEPAAPLSGQLSPEQEDALGIAPGYQAAHRRQMALHHAVDYAKAHDVGRKPDSRDIVAAAATFLAFLEG